MSQVTFNNLEIAAVMAKAWDLKILDRVKSHSLNRLVIKKKKEKKAHKNITSITFMEFW